MHRPVQVDPREPAQPQIAHVVLGQRPVRQQHPGLGIDPLITGAVQYPVAVKGNVLACRQITLDGEVVLDRQAAVVDVHAAIEVDAVIAGQHQVPLTLYSVAIDSKLARSGINGLIHSVSVEINVAVKEDPIGGRDVAGHFRIADDRQALQRLARSNIPIEIGSPGLYHQTLDALG